MNNFKFLQFKIKFNTPIKYGRNYIEISLDQRLYTELNTNIFVGKHKAVRPL